MIDITSKESLDLVKQLIEKLEQYFPNNKVNNSNENKEKDNNNQYDESILIYLKKILIINKTDLESERKVSEEDIFSLLNKFPNLDSIEISLKTLKGIPELSKKLLMSYEKIKDNNLPTDYVYEEQDFFKNPQNCSNLKAEASMNFIMIGDSQVGKSCFLMRYLRDSFSNSFLTTVGMDKEARLIKIKDEIIRLVLWDTAGQERFRSIPIKYYQNADGVLILFDLNNKNSFINVNNWAEDYKKNTNKNKTNMFLIGNKLDLTREVTKEEAIQKAKELGVSYYEVSCKTNVNINEVMARLILQCYPHIIKAGGNAKLDKNKNGKKNGGGCCGGGKKK